MDMYSKVFQQFAEKEAKGSSPLYYFLSNRVVEDGDLMKIIREIPASQPKPNLFFASIQYLLTKTHSPLREHYPSLTKNPLPVEERFALFKEFALNHKVQLIELFKFKLVQTNEVRRAAYLYPLFLSISEKTNKPLTLIEVGTSAGLLLCLDAYNYEYIELGKTLKIENVPDSIVLQSENRGDQLPSFIQSKLNITNRFGIDLNIVDLNDQQEYEWMLALIWPEHSERRKQFKEASQIANNIKKDMLQGDLLKLLPTIIQSIDPENQIVVFHTHVANQFPAQLKKDFAELLDEFSYTRSIYHVYNNMFDTNLHQDYMEDGRVIEETIFKSPDGHGRWFFWS